MKLYYYKSLDGFAFWRVYGVVKVLLIQCRPSETVFQSNRVVSQPCPFNNYVVTYENGTHTCTRCSVCSRGFQRETKCSAYNDTACETCASGWYNDVSGSSCQPCSGCEDGKYIRRYCSSKRNTACRQCPRYTYTAKPNVTVCIPCSRCKQNQKRVSKCGSYRDTTCGDCDEDHFRLSSSGSCLPCTRCPAGLQQQHWVVPECSDKRGKNHPDICWPGNAYLMGFSSSSSLEGTVTMVTKERTDIKQDGNWGDDIYIVFIVASFGSVVCGTIVIALGFVCLRMVRSSIFIQHLNEDENAEDNETAIPLVSVYRNAGDKLNISDDSNENWISDGSLKELNAEDNDTAIPLVLVFQIPSDKLNISDDSSENRISNGPLNDEVVETAIQLVSVYRNAGDKLNTSDDSSENRISDGPPNDTNDEVDETAIQLSVYHSPGNNLNRPDCTTGYCRSYGRNVGTESSSNIFQLTTDIAYTNRRPGRCASISFKLSGSSISDDECDYGTTSLSASAPEMSVAKLKTKIIKVIAKKHKMTKLDDTMRSYYSNPR